jgi:hypothetical protein
VWRLFVLLRSPFFELARVLVRLDHIANIIVNANHFIVRADEKLTAFVELESAIRACGELS